jgi:hypothetical protein
MRFDSSKQHKVWMSMIDLAVVTLHFNPSIMSMHYEIAKV